MGQGDVLNREECIRIISDPKNTMHHYGGLVEQICTDPDILFDALTARVRIYYRDDDCALLKKAYEVAQRAHGDQKRKSGEPYIIHPLWVAILLASLEMDQETIASAILHDVMEDTDITVGELHETFGEDIVSLVDGVTKLGQIGYSADKIEEQAQNLRKMFLAMSKDIRVIIIKLCDRLHNMQTLQFMPAAKQREKAEETLDIYAPIAGRLGIYQMQSELDDLALRYLEPEAYQDILNQLSQYHAQRDSYLDRTVKDVSEHISKAGIKARIYGRVKHVFSIYKKMVQLNKDSVDQIYDIFAVRIIVADVKDCYAALGAIHDMYTPVPGRFKDYIAMPKPNMYQSLHSTLIGKEGKPFEIQIRTEEMHRVAEYGIAAHWQYKESGGSEKKAADGNDEAKLTWLRRILEWQQDTADNKEFMNILKGDLDLFSGEVYCFTPTGDVKTLPAGSTPIDFAYAIHSAVGNKMVGARANGKLVPIDYTIKNGDRIEVITSQNTRGPSRDWLKIVKSTQARSKINQWFKKQFKEENIVKGRRMVENYCREKRYNIDELLVPEYINEVLKKYRFVDWDAALAAVGHGGIKEGQIINRLRQAYRNDHRNLIYEEQVEKLAAEGKDKREKILKSKSGVMVKGVDDMAVHFSKCCNPVPGDEICAFITRGRGMSIHRTDCQNIMNLSDIERARVLPAEWVDASQMEGGFYQVDLSIYANNRKGLLMDLAKVFVENGVDLTQLNTKVSKQDTATIEVSFGVKNSDEVQDIMNKLKQVNDVIDIRRPVS